MPTAAALSSRRFWRAPSAVSRSRSTCASVGPGQGGLRDVRELRVALGQRGRLGRAARLPQRRLELGLALEKAIDRLLRLGIELHRAQRARVLPEVLAHAAVVVQLELVLEDEVLAHDALERRGLLTQLTAQAPGLRGAHDRRLALAGEAIESPRELEQRVAQRQAHQKETQQQELGKGARVVHGHAWAGCDAPPYNAGPCSANRNGPWTIHQPRRAREGRASRSSPPWPRTA
jgi:hypothetical protein